MFTCKQLSTVFYFYILFFLSSVGEKYLKLHSLAPPLSEATALTKGGWIKTNP